MNHEGARWETESPCLCPMDTGKQQPPPPPRNCPIDPQDGSTWRTGTRPTAVKRWSVLINGCRNDMIGQHPSRCRDPARTETSESCTPGPGRTGPRVIRPASTGSRQPESLGTSRMRWSVDGVLRN